MNNQQEPRPMHLISDVSDAIRRNPVSTALIGMGLLWLFAGDRAGIGAARLARKAGLDRMPDTAGDALQGGRAALNDGLDRVGETIAGVGDRVGHAAQAVRDSGAAALDRAGEFGRRIPETGADLFDTARTRLTDLFNEQPLLLGAIGVAIGAGIAASLPPTDIESDLFGDSSDEVKAQARGFAQRTTERVTAAARGAAEAAAEEARRQGLSPEGAMAAAGEVGEKAKRVAEAAEENFRLE